MALCKKLHSIEAENESPLAEELVNMFLICVTLAAGSDLSVWQRGAHPAEKMEETPMHEITVVVIEWENVNHFHEQRWLSVGFFFFFFTCCLHIVVLCGSCIHWDFLSSAWGSLPEGNYDFGNNSNSDTAVAKDVEMICWSVSGLTFE